MSFSPPPPPSNAPKPPKKVRSGDRLRSLPSLLSELEKGLREAEVVPMSSSDLARLISLAEEAKRAYFAQERARYAEDERWSSLLFREREEKARLQEWKAQEEERARQKRAEEARGGLSLSPPSEHGAISLSEAERGQLSLVVQDLVSPPLGRRVWGALTDPFSEEHRLRFALALCGIALGLFFTALAFL